MAATSNLNSISLVDQSEKYHLLKIVRYLNSPSAKSFSPYCISVSLSEVESVDFYKVLFVSCFRHIFQTFKNFNVTLTYFMPLTSFDTP